ncbi:MAG: sulfotransferase domain-containing protein [Deltaproteobacteria bacterium]|nr:sulfotransferase domain-containing protein [Deltaproteobacteria bacterium]
MKKTFVNSFPKSGTNLMCKCLELFGYRELGGLASSQVLSRGWRSILRRILWQSYTKQQGYLVGIDTPVEIVRWAIDSRLRKAHDATFLFGHVGYTADLLMKINAMEFKPILIVRDPRAILSSFVHYVLANTSHALHIQFVKMTEDDRWKAGLVGYFEGRVTLQPLKLRCEALAPWLNAPEVLKLRFEDLVGERGGGTNKSQVKILGQICHFLHIPQERITAVSEQLFGPSKLTFRRGQVDSWKEEIPENIILQANDVLEPILTAWGYAK